MDNKLIIVQSEGRKSFDLAFQIFFESNIKATHYLEDPEKGLIFFYYYVGSEFTNNKPIKLPTPLAAQQAADLAWSWLLAQPEDCYGAALDHDGSNSKGFKVYNEDWNRVGSYDGSILAIQPVWAWYGK